MPLRIPYRLPVPTLTTYSILSTALFGSLVYNVKQITKNPDWKNDLIAADKNASDPLMDDSDDHLIDFDNVNLPESIRDVLIYMIQDSFSRWVSSQIFHIESEGYSVHIFYVDNSFHLHITLCNIFVISLIYKFFYIGQVFINAIICTVVLFGKSIQRIVFGDLRAVEINNFREKLCNYFLYKCIFMFGVIKVQTTEEVIFLLGWFGLLGFQQVFVQFSKDRLEYVSKISHWLNFSGQDFKSISFSVDGDCWFPYHVYEPLQNRRFTIERVQSC